MQFLPPIIPGTDYALTFTYRNVDGTLEDNSGNTMRVVVKLNATDSAALFDQVFQGNVADAPVSFNTTIPGATTKSFPPNASVAIQAQRTLSSGGTDSPLLTQVKVLQEVIE